MTFENDLDKQHPTTDIQQPVRINQRVNQCSVDVKFTLGERETGAKHVTHPYDQQLFFQGKAPASR